MNRHLKQILPGSTKSKVTDTEQKQDARFQVKNRVKDQNKHVIIFIPNVQTSQEVNIIQRNWKSNS